MVRTTRGRTRAQINADRWARASVVERASTDTTEQMREKRDAAWARVRRVESTRWDLTKYERLDEAYRARCIRTGETYHPEM